MTIYRFQGKTEEEAIENAKKEMGPSCVIMNSRIVKPKGLFGFLKTSYYEVTAAIEEKEQALNTSAFSSIPRAKTSIDLAADEKIVLPPIAKKEDSLTPEAKPSFPANDDLGERIDNLKQLIEKQIPRTVEPAPLKETAPLKEELLKDLEDLVPEEKEQSSVDLLRMVYNTLIDNEVDERYANQLVEDVMKVVRKGSSMDFIISNIYQKMILKFGNPRLIEVPDEKPGIVFFIGPTGVGKTTTIAKLASSYKLKKNLKIAFITADTYRISATDQLRTYANILDAPMIVIYSADEMAGAVRKLSDYDLIFVDTAGFSHKNESQREDTKRLIESVRNDYVTSVYLVLSATTKYRDLKEICDIYHKISDYSIIFTKTDETGPLGCMYNIRLYSGADISYVANGQNVPDDIEEFVTQETVKKLLGGN